MKRHIAILLSVLAATPMLAHHSVKSEFDSTKAMPISGIITRVEWTNPHAWIYMDVKDAAGQTVAWRVELAAPGALTRAGFDKSLIALKSPITIEVWPAIQDPSVGRAGNGRLLTLSDGRTFDVSDKWPDAKIMK